MGEGAPLALQDYNYAAVLGTVVRFAGRVISLLLLNLPIQFADRYFVSFMLQLYSHSSEIDVTAVLSLFCPLLLAYRLDLLYPQHDF